MPAENIQFDYSHPPELILKLNGDFLVSGGLPDPDEIIGQVNAHKELNRITFDASGIGKWDSALVAVIFRLIRECEGKNIRVERGGLPQGAQKLLELALKASEKTAKHPGTDENFLERVADRVIKAENAFLSILDFLGEITLGFSRVITGKAYFRWDEFTAIVQRCGADAFALVSLISLLVGMILAFIGAIQLKLFGAQIYVADIVGIGMVRVMGAVMTGILMAGRTGASFAAELGLMEANEEIDALKTLGISPAEFLVVPRVLALVIMLPLLTLYSDFMGVLGGFAVSAGMLGLNPVEYWQHTQSSVKLSNLWIGLIHGFVFGIIVAIAGCLKGIRCERSAAAVGEAATSAVVNGITGIVVATAIITLICQLLGV